MTTPQLRKISRSTLLLLVLLSAISLSVHAEPTFKQLQAAGRSATKISTNTVLVRFKPGAARSERNQAHGRVNGNATKRLDVLGIDVVKVPQGTVHSAVALYLKNPIVEFAEPNHTRMLYRPVTTEGTEPTLGVANMFEEQYGLHNTGQWFGVTVDPLFGTLIYPAFQAANDADINAPEGWAISNGSSLVGIAILDSGIACDHLDLIGKCIEEVNYVEDHQSPPTLEDVLGHGTHVAGIAAATTDNGIGIAGVGRNSSIGSLKVCYEDYSMALFGIILGQCEDDDVAAAIIHAADSGLYEVINMSLAGPDPSLTLEAAVNYAWNAGLVLIAGAGNQYTLQVQYPAGYDNVIAVGATDFYDNLAAFSQFGPSWVSVLAPGTEIISTVPGEFCGQPEGDPSDCYDYKSGTSMSTPHVAGLAALLWANLPAPTNSGIRGIIEDSADTTGAMGQNFQAWVENGRINMGSALNSNATPTEHHVDSILLSTVNAGRGNKFASAMVTIVDQFGNPVSNATVSGTFSGDFDEFLTSPGTNGSGTVSLTTTSSQKGGVTFTFCVTDVAHATTAYDPSVDLASCATF